MISTKTNKPNGKLLTDIIQKCQGKMDKHINTVIWFCRIYDFLTVNKNMIFATC